MIRNVLHGLMMRSQPDRQRTPGRRRRRPWVLEGLEDRVLLSLSPTIYTVTSTGPYPTVAGTLASAIMQANVNPNPAGSLIEFSTPLFSAPQTITLSSTLKLTGSAGPITIDGPGASLLTISGNNQVEVFQVNWGATAAFSGLTISSGLTIYGGGIDNTGTLTLSNVAITNNIAANGPAGDEGGGIWNDGLMTVSDCTITNNSDQGNGEGGGISNYGTMTITNSTIANNSVISGDYGAGIYNSGVITVSACTIATNTAGSGGEGGGVYNNVILMIADSTVVGNSAGYEGGGIFNESTLTAVNVTMAHNSVAIGGQGGGLFAAAAATTTTLDNTIIAQNIHFGASSTVPDDIAGTLSTYPPSTFNLIGTGGAGGLTNGVNGNQVGVASPGLASGPAYNGGPTQTIALLPGSPAIDAGSNLLDGLPYDQRGLPRIYNGTIDIGAYEFQPALVTAIIVHWGTAGTASLQTADDGLRLLPAGRNNDLPWYGIDSLQITFDEPVTLTSAEVSLTGAKGTNYGPATITGSGETYTIMLSQPIDRPDRVTIMIAGAGIATYTRRLDVLPGDVNDDGVVNAADASSVKSESRGRTPTTIFDEILGSGMVQTADYKTVKKLEGKAFSRLPRISSTVMARVLARERLDNKHEHH